MADAASPDPNDILDLIEDGAETPVPPAGHAWKIAVIDDDAAVHDGTRFALADYRIEGRALELLSAHSAAQGRTLLRTHPDVAVVLLDVVMESDAAGLLLVDFIRKDLANDAVRIILRTGQPGQAPEQRVIVEYDINDYKAKTELTADKLFTTLTAALRSFQQLQRLQQTRRGLEIIVEAAATLFDLKSMRLLAEGVLTQIASILNADCAGILVLRESGRKAEPFAVLAGSGIYRSCTEAPPDALDPALIEVVEGAFSRRSHDFATRRTVLYLATGDEREIVVLLDVGKALLATDRTLIEVFCSRLSVAFDNVILYERLHQANRTLEHRVAERTRELTRALQRLKAQRERLRGVNAFKNEMLGKVAHDLKNPLAVVLGRAEILGELLRATPIRREHAELQVANIRDAALRLTNMADALIADAMADALAIQIRREPLDLTGLVAEVIQANRPLAERKRQTLTLSASGDLRVSGDQERLREAIDNLVSNAVKYSPVDGRIDLEVAQRDGECFVRVSDQGVGLSGEDMSRLFGRFQRLSAKPTGGETSTGLGLSIAKRIVDLHGGRLFADLVKDGSGAVFTLALPVQ